MKKSLFTYLEFLVLTVNTVFLLSNNATAQTATIAGKVSSEQGKPLGFASVVLKQTNQGTTTRADGTFLLKDLAPGAYTLLVSSMGFQQQFQDVNVTAHEQLSVDITLPELAVALKEVVVTATRTTRSIDDIPLPVDVVSARQIETIGSLRLNEVLQEQTGLQITSNHGTGLMMQGLTSEYILFLIDGEPVIGRTAGTLDLSRLAVDNIERVEIIKGPSSSLYGSEAMAGVVNIITKKPDSGLSSSLRTRYRSYGTYDLSASAGFAREKFSASLFVNRLSTKGYDLTDETVSMTAPPFQAYTVSPKVAYRFSDAINLSINGRFYTESQENTADITVKDEIFRMDDDGRQQDWNLMPTLEVNLSDKHHLQLRSYTTGYRTNSALRYQSDGTVYDESYFDQFFNRSEVQYDWYINDKNVTTMGVGHTVETVEATRYDDINAFRANYGFVQHQWIPNEKFNIIAGGRYDTHNAYASRFSPKLAAGYTVNKWLKVQASFGGGYKAPDFRQLLLNFTNPVAGYSVVGSSLVQERIAELQAQGQIEAILIDPGTIETIRAESSIAYNVGLHISPGNKLNGELNVFRNEISNLIDTAPIARKTNGQNVFSYFNFDRVVTQGIEVKGSYRLMQGLDFSAGYQYLDSRNLEDVDKIKNREVFNRDPATNRTVAVSLAEYGGLPYRSRHSGNAKLFYTNSLHQFDVALRAIYRGRWGLGDANGNGVIEAGNEFADGYVLLNLALNKNLFGWLTVEGGANNLLNITSQNEPLLPGRIWYGGLNINFSDIHQQ